MSCRGTVSLADGVEAKQEIWTSSKSSKDKADFKKSCPALARSAVGGRLHFTGELTRREVESATRDEIFDEVCQLLDHLGHGGPQDLQALWLDCQHSD